MAELAMLAEIQLTVYPEKVTRQLHIMAQSRKSSPVIDQRSNHCANHEHTTAMATELLQPLDLVCGTLYRSNCTIQTLPTECFDDSWRDTFLGTMDTALCGFWYVAPYKNIFTLLTYLITYLLINNHQSTYLNIEIDLFCSVTMHGTDGRTEFRFPTPRLRERHAITIAMHITLRCNPIEYDLLKYHSTDCSGI